MRKLDRFQKSSVWKLFCESRFITRSGRVFHRTRKTRIETMKELYKYLRPCLFVFFTTDRGRYTQIIDIYDDDGFVVSEWIERKNPSDFTE